MTNHLRDAAEEHFNRGNALDEAGNRQGAISEWQEALEFYPDLAEAHYNLGIAYAEQADHEAAEIELREAVRCDPVDVDARRELAQVLFEKEELDAAVNQLKQALSIVPGDAETARLLANVYLEQGKWDQAAAALESGGMSEEDADLWLELGDAYEEMNRRVDAVLAYRRTLVCRADDHNAEAALSRLGVPVEEPPAEEEFEEGN